MCHHKGWGKEAYNVRIDHSRIGTYFLLFYLILNIRNYWRLFSPKPSI